METERNAGGYVVVHFELPVSKTPLPVKAIIPDYKEPFFPTYLWDVLYFVAGKVFLISFELSFSPLIAVLKLLKARCFSIWSLNQNRQMLTFKGF